jgi:hypothetical protein
MPEDDSDDLGSDAGAPDAGPIPIGDSGWIAGDFQNGAGLLGMVAPGAGVSGIDGAFASQSSGPAAGVSAGPYALGDTGWQAGDLENGSGLLGLVPPAGYSSMGQSQSSTDSDGETENTASPGQFDSGSPDNSASSPAGEVSPDDSGVDGADSDKNGAISDETSPSWNWAKGFQSDGRNSDEQDARLDFGLATPGGAGLIPVAQNRTVKRQWSRQENRDWPVTEDGRSYHAHHKVPLADGGSKTLENIEPMHPDEHTKHHMDNGDFRRWGGGGRPIGARRLRLRSPPLKP